MDNEQWTMNYSAILWGVWSPKWQKIQQKVLEGTRRSAALLWFLANLSNEIWKITDDIWKIEMTMNTTICTVR
jgi:hypothetical protein